MARPKKYASDAERQAAFRARWGTLSVQIEPETIQTVRELAEFYDASQAEIVSQALKFAFLNHSAFQKSGAALPFKRMRKQNPE